MGLIIAAFVLLVLALWLGLAVKGIFLLLLIGVVVLLAFAVANGRSV